MPTVSVPGADSSTGVTAGALRPAALPSAARRVVRALVGLCRPESSPAALRLAGSLEWFRAARWRRWDRGLWIRAAPCLVRISAPPAALQPSVACSVPRAPRRRARRAWPSSSLEFAGSLRGANAARGGLLQAVVGRNPWVVDRLPPGSGGVISRCGHEARPHRQPCRASASSLRSRWISLSSLGGPEWGLCRLRSGSRRPLFGGSSAAPGGAARDLLMS